MIVLLTLHGVQYLNWMRFPTFSPEPYSTPVYTLVERYPTSALHRIGEQHYFSALEEALGDERYR